MTQQIDRVPRERRTSDRRVLDRRAGASTSRRRPRFDRPQDRHADRDTWQHRHAFRLATTDAMVLGVAVLVAMVTKFGADAEARINGPVGLTYPELGAIIVAGWWLSLVVFRSRDQRLFGDDAEEYRRVIKSTVFTFSTVAIVSMMLKIDMSRGYLAIAFPLGMMGLLFSRRYWRIWLRRQRSHGRALSRVLVIGGVRSSTCLAHSFEQDRAAGFRVTGVWVPDEERTAICQLDVGRRSVPVLGTERPLSSVLAIADADTVILTDTEHLGQEGLRELIWQLEAAGVDLMVSPNLVDVAGTRLHMRGISDMSFLHLEQPQYAAAGAWPKALFDRIGAAVLIVCLSPLLALAAVAVKLSSSGPVFYRQTRIGRGGEPFTMIKFRSMRDGAHSELHSLLVEQGTADLPLFKIRRDPRITSVGAFLRRFSIDEIPQLFNVIRGDMSLVGPRPQQAAEVELYDDRAHRRLRVRPGMSGLWQVSGRSDLPWDEAIRLDTSYVENWSMTGDLMILWRTVRAVLRSHGAY